MRCRRKPFSGNESPRPDFYFHRLRFFPLSLADGSEWLKNPCERSNWRIQAGLRRTLASNWAMYRQSANASSVQDIPMSQSCCIQLVALRAVASKVAARWTQPDQVAAAMCIHLVSTRCSHKPHLNANTSQGHAATSQLLRELPSQERATARDSA